MGESRYWLQTLGCPKNQVDSDKLVGVLSAEGLVPAVDPAHADLVIVNTCAFIEAARQESIDQEQELVAPPLLEQLVDQLRALGHLGRGVEQLAQVSPTASISSTTDRSCSRWWRLSILTIPTSVPR